MQDSEEDVAPPQVAHAQTAGAIAVADPATAWLSYSFAPEWYADAAMEARASRSHAARRRELVFAVCCVESYLVEWVANEVLARDYASLGNYFPVTGSPGIKDRWKQVVKRLRDDDKIPAAPDFGGRTWFDFTRLVDFRDGLVHGSSSRPQTAGQAADLQPFPAKSHLDSLEPGWAVRVVAALIGALHDAVGTTAPTWLTAP